MHTDAEIRTPLPRPTGEIVVWTPQHDPALRDLMRAQMLMDPNWPPGYAYDMDLAKWLGLPADINRWVATVEGEVCGHAGLGHVQPDDLGKQLFCAAGTDQLAEICRMVVDPGYRGANLAAMLTRKAMRTSIEAGLVPIAKVLGNRGTWLINMLKTGWRDVARVEVGSPGEDYFGLLPPERCVEAALETRALLAAQRGVSGG